MAYDMENPPKHNAPLYQSSKFPGWFNCDMAVKAHCAKGVPASMLVLGMPFMVMEPIFTTTPQILRM